MKKILYKFSLMVLFGFAAWRVRAEDLVWLTDLGKAQAQAKAENKTVLLFFHGSDWCPTCIELQKQVFQSKEFADYARQALVLVDVDFPKKTTLNESLQQTNKLLKAKFNIAGFPTVVLVDENNRTVFEEADYNGGGPGEVLPNLQRHAKVPEPPGAGGFKNLDVAEFAKMAADPQNVILDVRTAKEFRAGHIAGAMNVDVMSGDFERKAGALDKDKTYLVHCAAGARSVRACEQLGKLNFLKLYNLKGGFNAWVEAGQPVAK